MTPQPTQAELAERGEKMRRMITTDAYVDHMLATRTPFDSEWQDFLTEQLFGRTWARGIIDHPTLSMINLAMLAGRGCMEEFEIHFRAALTRTGVPLIQLRELLLHIAMYCGAPIGRDAFKIARKCFADLNIDVSEIDLPPQT
ncbi:carboxymuconolactone decarboxylase family protein [Pseudogemmobacter sonorensis]|uniref:carboxymuconolactone decarboxylase family protein n=1 Tax=Pseudogemmobacter sonorensis TaxID=2989681 RepID=UPI003698760A